MKKYKDIERLKDKYAPAFKSGEHITITEKIDGANASIVVNEDGTLTACSRRNELNQNNTLQGFYDFVQTLDASIVSAALTSRYILFGEWLVKHTIRYPEDKMKQFYVFDVYDTETEQYMMACCANQFEGEKQHSLLANMIVLVQWHMESFADSEHYLEKFKATYGEDMCKVYELVHEADLNAH